ncbi:tripartite tricarboxylate transporter TctB family protein [Microbacterium sp. MPKO10]|uniref:tripartite tricarboxylate transporter TctB family protein n=1 Tax=Microbacterium sp. MPKO10 TaxID=2989818 RepID=UPI0022355A4C|nr:tripartite tricarboxylate transporter TctB family protein [Microbacterium sp. MPKO10]MCW4456899.1 tripartite tricarboxylate transporter TctB family protein [Microbacterium sp. MPKO10]
MPTQRDGAPASEREPLPDPRVTDGTSVTSDTTDGTASANEAESAATASRPGNFVGEIVFAVLCVAIGILALVVASQIHVPPTANTVGPQVFPYIVGGVLSVVGLATLIAVFFGARGEAEDSEDADATMGTDWLTVAKLVVFFLAHAFLIEYIGWPFAAALLFFGAAWALGATSLWRAAVAGLAMGLVIELAFGVGLGLSLPAGPLLNWIPIFNG